MKKSPAIVLLLVLLLAMIGTVVYYVGFKKPADITAVTGEAATTANTADNQPTVNTIDTSTEWNADNNAIISPKDSVHFNKPAQTAKNQQTEQPAEPVKDTPAPTVIAASVPTQPTNTATEESAEEKPVVIPLSKMPDVTCDLYVKDMKQRLMVYPNSGDWSKMFVMFPANKNIPNSMVLPGFAGVSYPTRKKGKLDNGSKKIDVAYIELSASANAKRPYNINLKNIDFMIFGDYADKNKWFIYENKQISRFNNAYKFTEESTVSN